MKKTDSFVVKNLKLILEQGEDYKTEFKETAGPNLDKEIVAFANSSGGKIYLGITDESKVKGINVTNKLKSRIEDIATNCDPKISILLQEIKKEKILIVEVPESKHKPHSCSSGFYVRSGASSRKLNRDEILNFAEEEDLLSFDKALCKEFDFKKDFDKEKLFSFMDRTGVKYNRRNYMSILENLQVIKKEKSKIVMNNAGVLFFSKDLSKFFFHTEITCGLFKGTEKVHVLDSARFNTSLIENVEGAMSFLWKSLKARHEIIPRTAQRIDVLEVPDKALREALINAVTHRNYINRSPFIQLEIYDDRVEISNFGGLPKGLTKKQFGKKSVPRNQLIAKLMLRARYIEEMGTGINKMRTLVKKEGLPPVKFEFDNFTTLTFYRKPRSNKTFIMGSGISAREKLYRSGLESDIIMGSEILAREKLYRSGLESEFFQERKAPENSNQISIREKLTEITKMKREKIDELLQILEHIEKGTFSKKSFADNHKIALRTLERSIKLLKKYKLVFFKGYPRAGKYKITEKFKKLKNGG